MWLLAPATFFEGYDGLLFGLALPLIRSEFDVDLRTAGLLGSLMFAGSFGSLGLLALADRYGRRRLLTLTIAGYTLATGLTATSRGIVDFTAYQMLARLFLGAERPLASITVVETFPRVGRGRALGVLSSALAFGQATAGLGFVAALTTGLSWRLLYAAGVLPLLVVTATRRHLPETLPLRSVEGEGFDPPTVTAAALLAFAFSLFPTAVTVFASTLVLEEWGWKLTSLNPVWVALWAAALSGFFVAGRAMDDLGRKPAGAVALFGATVAGFMAFPARTDPVRAIGLAAVIFFLAASAPVVSGFTTEPFPAAVRGRVGAVTRASDILGSAVAPGLVGVLTGTLGGLGAALAGAGVSYALGGLIVLAFPVRRPAVSIRRRGR